MSTAGYSGTPLPGKLGIKPGHLVRVVDAPDEFEQILGDLPEAVELERAEASSVGTGNPPDVVLLFVMSVAALESGVSAVAPGLPPDSAIWVAWPKRSSGIETDMTEDVIRDYALPRGLVDNKVCAIDQTWSGLRLVVRKENRADWPSAFDS